MNLLQALNGSRLHTVEQAALDKRIGFFLALSIYGIIAINEPVEKCHRAVARVILSHRFYALSINHIGKTLFTIWSLEFEVVSDTNQLNAILNKLSFQVLPIVSRFLIILLIVDCSSSQTARTSRSLKKRIDFLLISVPILLQI